LRADKIDIVGSLCRPLADGAEVASFLAESRALTRPGALVKSAQLRKAELGQFMTPPRLAEFMASLFSERRGPFRLLDAGAGSGSLTAAFVDRWGSEGSSVSAYEVDPAMLPRLRATIKGLDGINARIISNDFIQDAVYRIALGDKGQGFTHAILNPPYKKISSGSAHRALLGKIGLETVNLYTAFVGLAIELMAPGGEIVAIIPRSFCNGPYYKPFREWMLSRTSIEHIHLFHSRTEAFSDDEVLQENVIIKLVRARAQGRVTISTTRDTSLTDLRSHEYEFPEILQEGDAQKFIHVPTDPLHSDIGGIPLAARTLSEIGLEVSTGPVVDFRLRDFLVDAPENGTVPLLYPTHFAEGALEWPRQSKKPNAIRDLPETRKWLYPNGFYTVVRRFSSKEERRRVVANVVDPSAFSSNSIGFENHLNVFHSGKKGIDRNVAHGLSVFLNSTVVDDYFRRFSGHTQVNATDLRMLRYPDAKALARLGAWVQQHTRPAQDMIDEQVRTLNGTSP